MRKACEVRTLSKRLFRLLSELPKLAVVQGHSVRIPANN